MIPETSEEILPLVDEQGNVIGHAPRSFCHGGSKALHPVVHLHIVAHDRSGLLMQKRSMTKRIQPGKWDTSVGGHISYGETVSDGLRREAIEEASLMDFEPVEITRYVFESAVERELINCFACVAPADYQPRSEEGEADSVRFWPWDEIREALGHGVFTPNFESEYSTIEQSLREL